MTNLDVKCPACGCDEVIAQESLLSGKHWLVCLNPACKAKYKIQRDFECDPRLLYTIRVDNLSAAEKLMDLVSGREDMEIII